MIGKRVRAPNNEIHYNILLSFTLLNMFTLQCEIYEVTNINNECFISELSVVYIFHECGVIPGNLL